MWGGVMWAGAPWAGLPFGGAARCFGDVEGFDSVDALGFGSELAPMGAGEDRALALVVGAETAAFVYGTTASRASVIGGDRKRKGC